MHDRPALVEEAILATLRAAYGLPITALTFLPLGHDAASAVYRAGTAGGESFLVKLRSSDGFAPASLLVPRHLHDQGVPGQLPPRPARDGTLWIRLDQSALSLFPFVDSRTGAAAGLSDRQWHVLGETVRQIHDSRLPPPLARSVRRETYVPAGRALLADLEAAVARRDLDQPALAALAGRWRAQRQEIDALVQRVDKLGPALSSAGRPLVLCHGDLHTWNVLVDSAQQLWLVDWDEVILAPQERDLMFVVGGIGHGLVTPHQTACFLAGYGQATVDPLALTYYRAAWAVQDIIEYARHVLLAPDASMESRLEAVAGFADLFAPGNIVDIALERDAGAATAPAG